MAVCLQIHCNLSSSVCRYQVLYFQHPVHAAAEFSSGNGAGGKTTAPGSRRTHTEQTAGPTTYVHPTPTTARVSNEPQFIPSDTHLTPFVPPHAPPNNEQTAASVKWPSCSELWRFAQPDTPTSIGSKPHATPTELEASTHKSAKTHADNVFVTRDLDLLIPQ